MRVRSPPAAVYASHSCYATRHAQLRTPKKAKGGVATAKSSKGKKSLLQDGPGKGEADGGPPGLMEDIDGAGPGLLSAFVASHAPTELSAVTFPAGRG